MYQKIDKANIRHKTSTKAIANFLRRVMATSFSSPEQSGTASNTPTKGALRDVEVRNIFPPQRELPTYIPPSAIFLEDTVLAIFWQLLSLRPSHPVERDQGFAPRDVAYRWQDPDRHCGKEVICGGCAKYRIYTGHRIHAGFAQHVAKPRLQTFQTDRLPSRGTKA